LNDEIPLRGDPSVSGKGFVEHRMFNLNVSVHALENGQCNNLKESTKEVRFDRRILKRTQIVPPSYEFYFVRPGIRQVVTHIISIPSDVSLIRITSSFDYDRKGRWPHTARRVFSIQSVDH
jgi:hypothetical protein